MANYNETVSTLEKIDFGTLLGAPLSACVEAQAQAAKATSNYIRSMGFNQKEEYNLEAKLIHFNFMAGGKKKRLTVPLISVVPLPYLQVDNVNLKFAADVALEDGYLVGKVSTDDNAQSQQTTSSKFNSDLKIKIDIKATTSDMPYGISRILEVMNKAAEEGGVQQ